MANGMNDTNTSLDPNDPWASARPTWLPSIEEYRTPAEDWAAFTSGMQPFWSTRAPLADVGRNLQARYLLGAPQMAESGATPTFAQYLSDYPTAVRSGPVITSPMGKTFSTTPDSMPSYMAFRNPNELRQRAREAAAAATTATGPYLAELDPGTAEWNRRAWLSGQFGANAANAAANQRAVASLLALQRPSGVGGGVYRGQMATAIRNAIDNLYQQRLAQGAPKETFLDWYIRKTD